METISAIQRARLIRNTTKMMVDVTGLPIILFKYGQMVAGEDNIEAFLKCENHIVSNNFEGYNARIIEPKSFSLDSLMESITTFQNLFFSKIDDCESFHRVVSFDKDGVYFAVLFEQSNANPFGRKMGDKLITSPSFVSYETLAKEWCYTNGVDYFNAFVKSAYEIYIQEYKSNN